MDDNFTTVAIVLVDAFERVDEGGHVARPRVVHDAHAEQLALGCHAFDSGHGCDAKIHVVCSVARGLQCGRGIFRALTGDDPGDMRPVAKGIGEWVEARDERFGDQGLRYVEVVVFDEMRMFAVDA